MSIITICGIDPALNNTGYAIVDYCRHLGCDTIERKFVTSGIIKCKPKMELPDKLAHTYNTLTELFIQGEYVPDIVIIEDVFIGRNMKTALKQAMTLGVILLLCANYKFDWKLVSPATVKKAVFKGNATKDEVRMGVEKFYNINTSELSEHEVDAMAVCSTYKESES